MNPTTKGLSDGICFDSVKISNFNTRKDRFIELHDCKSTIYLVSGENIISARRGSVGFCSD